MATVTPKRSTTRKGSVKRILWTVFVLFFLINFVAFFQAYKLTHFADETVVKTNSADKLTTFEKVQALIFGVKLLRPSNKLFPSQPFETLILQSNKKIECWSIKTENAKGTVILFHGYGANKASMLDKSDEFIKLGYNTLLVDFMGSGGSEGNQTTIGFKEAAEVQTSFDYLQELGEKKILLFGTSMGAAAILKVIDEYKLMPAGIIIECPFGSMYQTTCARFDQMNIPSFPMAGLLVFWGGVQNGFWAFGHNPIEYAKSVECPTLLLYGTKDEKVSRKEIDEIFKNLKGKKELKTYPLAGHENYLRRYKQEWINDIKQFLETSQQ